MAKVQIQGGGFKRLSLLSSHLPKQLSGPVAKAFEKALEEELGEIARRTSQGKDADGKSFARYSKAYAKRKAASGRSSSPVNLTWTGKMLQSLRVKVSPMRGYLEGRLFPLPLRYAPKKRKDGAPSKARRGPPLVPEVAKYNQERRKFFALNAKQLSRIINKVKQAIGL